MLIPLPRQEPLHLLTSFIFKHKPMKHSQAALFTGGKDGVSAPVTHPRTRGPIGDRPEAVHSALLHLFPCSSRSFPPLPPSPLSMLLSSCPSFFFSPSCPSHSSSPSSSSLSSLSFSSSSCSSFSLSSSFLYSEFPFKESNPWSVSLERIGLTEATPTLPPVPPQASVLALLFPWGGCVSQCLYMYPHPNLTLREHSEA